MGIFIGDENFRSNGYGTEAIRLLLEYGFKYLNLHSIGLDLLETEFEGDYIRNKNIK